MSALLTCSPPRVLPTDQASDGETPPAELAESGSASHPSLPGATKDATEVSSQQAPLEPDTGGAGDDVMAEANTSTTEDPGERPLPDTEETGREDVQSPPRWSPQRTMPPEASVQSLIGDQANRSPPAPSTNEWPAMGEALSSASISREHRTLMGTVLRSIQSVDHGLKEAFNGLLTGF